MNLNHIFYSVAKQLQNEHGFVFKTAKVSKTDAISSHDHAAGSEQGALYPSIAGSGTVDRRRTSALVAQGPLNLRVQALRARRSYAPSALRKDYALLLSPEEIHASEKTGQLRFGGARRRSSWGMRGKRVSAANNGLCPLPHESIEAAELYRHINAELSDPNRMRQLLVWCAERSATRSHGYRQDLANDINQLIDEIQTEVIEALLDKALNVSWYHRPMETFEAETPVKKALHPSNEENLKRLEGYEYHLRQLQMEERLWASIVHEHNARHLEIFGRRQAPSINSHQWEAESIIGQQCSDYIDPDAHAWIIQQAHYLRVEVDTLDHIRRYTNAFQHRICRYTERVFAHVLKAYEEREKAARKIDPMDVLRLLSVAHPPVKA